VEDTHDGSQTVLSIQAELAFPSNGWAKGRRPRVVLQISEQMGESKIPATSKKMKCRMRSRFHGFLEIDLTLPAFLMDVR